MANGNPYKARITNENGVEKILMFRKVPTIVLNEAEEEVTMNVLNPLGEVKESDIANEISRVQGNIDTLQIEKTDWNDQQRAITKARTG